MKRLLATFLALTLLWTHAARADTAFVQATNAANAGPLGTLATTAFGSNTAVGSTILLVVFWDHATVTNLSSCSDSKGNTYTLVGTAFNSANDQTVQICFSLNIGTAGAAHTVSANFSNGNASAIRLVAHEVSGVLTAAALDQSTYNQDTSAAPTAAALTTTTAKQYIFACVNNDSASTTHTYSAGSGFTEPANSTASAGANEAMCEYQVQAAAGSVTASWTRSGSGHNVWGVATFKAASAGATQTGTQSLMGFGK